MNRITTAQIDNADKGKLQIVNTYSSPSSNDVNYFILNIWQQLGFNQEKDELYITGLDEIRKEIMPYLKKYIKNLYGINPLCELKDSETKETDNIPFDIQSLILCE